MGSTRTRVSIEEIRNTIEDMLQQGYPPLSAVANRLGVAQRTMQRRLAAEGTSYTDLLNELRFELAAKMLADPRTKISSIASAAGFANHSGFTRAFHQWAGVTPRQYRANLQRESMPLIPQGPIVRQIPDMLSKSTHN